MSSKTNSKDSIIKHFSKLFDKQILALYLNRYKTTNTERSCLKNGLIPSHWHNHYFISTHFIFLHVPTFAVDQLFDIVRNHSGMLRRPQRHFFFIDITTISNSEQTPTINLKIYRSNTHRSSKQTNLTHF